MDLVVKHIEGIQSNESKPLILELLLIANHTVFVEVTQSLHNH